MKTIGCVTTWLGEGEPWMRLYGDGHALLGRLITPAVAPNISSICTNDLELISWLIVFKTVPCKSWAAPAILSLMPACSVSSNECGSKRLCQDDLRVTRINYTRDLHFLWHRAYVKCYLMGNHHSIDPRGQLLTKNWRYNAAKALTADGVCIFGSGPGLAIVC